MRCPSSSSFEATLLIPMLEILLPHPAQGNSPGRARILSFKEQQDIGLLQKTELRQERHLVVVQFEIRQKAIIIEVIQRGIA